MPDSSYPIIGACFDKAKATSGSYGQEFWKIVWGAIDPTDLFAFAFWEGDTDDTLSGNADIYCIAFQNPIATDVDRIAAALQSYKPFQKVAADPMFIVGGQCTSEPLDSAGMMESGWRFTDDASNPRRALAALKGVPFEFFDDPDWKFNPPFI